MLLLLDSGSIISTSVPGSAGKRTSTQDETFLEDFPTNIISTDESGLSGGMSTEAGMVREDGSNVGGGDTASGGQEI